MTPRLRDAVVLVTGANGGLGQQFVTQALDRGAAKVYATARTPREWSDPRACYLHLDVLDFESIASAASAASDTTIVINNAGIVRRGPLVTAELANVRLLFETNFFGALEVGRVFAPVLASNGGGVLLDVLSTLAWSHTGGAYSAAKAALWAATDSLRLELAPYGTLVTGLVLGWTRTPMTEEFDAPMNDPADIVRAALDGIEAGETEILADQESVELKLALAQPVEKMYPQLRRRLVVPSD